MNVRLKRINQPMGHYAHQSSSVDDDDTNKDGQLTTETTLEPFSSGELNAFLPYKSKRPVI